MQPVSSWFSPPTCLPILEHNSWTSPHHQGGHISLRKCHLSSLIPPKCPSQPLKLGTSLKKHIYKYIKMCVECLAEEGFLFFVFCFFFICSSRQWRSSQGLGESQTCFCWLTIVQFLDIVCPMKQWYILWVKFTDHVCKIMEDSQGKNNQRVTMVGYRTLSALK